MKPIVFDSNVSTFTTQGNGPLDCISCIVTEELNGSFELELKVPYGSIHSEYLVERNLIVCRPSYSGSRQAFRIYSVKNNLNRTITVNARHISYDLSGYPVSPFTASGTQEAVSGLLSHCLLSGCPFQITTEINTIDITRMFNVDVPSSVRSWFGGKEGSIIDLYGGEWEYDNFNCYLRKSRGANRGVRIAYRKNLSDYQNTRTDSAYSHLIGYWADDDGNCVYCDPVSTGNSALKKCGYLDLSEKYEEQPAPAEITSAVQRYIAANAVDQDGETLSVGLSEIASSASEIELGDTILVVIDGQFIQSRVRKTVWNVLADRYEKIELGTKKKGITDAIRDAGTLSGASASNGGNTGTNDYEQLINKPEIEGVELFGNKTIEDLGVSHLSNLELEAMLN